MDAKQLVITVFKALRPGISSTCPFAGEGDVPDDMRTVQFSNVVNTEAVRRFLPIAMDRK